MTKKTEVDSLSSSAKSPTQQPKTGDFASLIGREGLRNVQKMETNLQKLAKRLFVVVKYATFSSLLSLSSSFLRFLIIAFVNVFQMYSSLCSECFLSDTKTKLCSGFLEVFPS